MVGRGENSDNWLVGEGGLNFCVRATPLLAHVREYMTPRKKKRKMKTLAILEFTREREEAAKRSKTPAAK